MSETYYAEPTPKRRSHLVLVACGIFLFTMVTVFLLLLCGGCVKRKPIEAPNKQNVIGNIGTLTGEINATGKAVETAGAAVGSGKLSEAADAIADAKNHVEASKAAVAVTKEDVNRLFASNEDVLRRMAAFQKQIADYQNSTAKWLIRGFAAAGLLGTLGGLFVFIAPLWFGGMTGGIATAILANLPTKRWGAGLLVFGLCSTWLALNFHKIQVWVGRCILFTAIGAGGYLIVHSIFTANSKPNVIVVQSKSLWQRVKGWFH